MSGLPAALAAATQSLKLTKEMGEGVTAQEAQLRSVVAGAERTSQAASCQECRMAYLFENAVADRTKLK